MMEVLAGVLAGLCLALGGMVLYLRGRGASKAAITVGAGGLEGLQRVGDLVVLRANWSIPAIGKDHVLGEVGRKFLRWLWSENKTIMIFRFEIRFKYDLRDPSSVQLSAPMPHLLEVRLGNPTHEISLSDVRFYHTEKGQLLDWLLPRALNIFTSDLDDASRQQILEAAQQNAQREAELLAVQLRGDARASAEATLTALGRSAGFAEVRILRDSPVAPPVAAAPNP